MNRNIGIIALLTAVISTGLVTNTCWAKSTLGSVNSMRINGWDMPYTEQGEGPLVVLIHGAVSDHRTWTSQQEQLAQRGYRVVAITQRYYGSGAWSEDWPKYRIRTHANDLAAFLRQLGPEKAHLVAWSSGVHIALTIAKEHPELVSSIFGYEPVVPSYVDDPDRLTAIDEDAGAMVGPVFEPMQSGDLREAAWLFLDGVSQQPGYFEDLSDTARQIVLDNARVLPLMFDGGELDAPISCVELAQLSPPITVAQGELSRPFFNLIADSAHQCLPTARHLVVSGVRHMWPAESPDSFVQAVDEAIRAIR